MHRTTRAILAATFCLALGTGAAAQPFTYQVSVTTSPGQVIAALPMPGGQRKRLIFHNPNDSVKVAVCPCSAGISGTSCSSRGGSFTPAINGAGCTTILPYDRYEVSGSTASGPQQAMPSAWMAVGSGSGNLTIYEFE
jgi:hypothetical protein